MIPQLVNGIPLLIDGLPLLDPACCCAPCRCLNAGMAEPYDADPYLFTVSGYQDLMWWTQGPDGSPPIILGTYYGLNLFNGSYYVYKTSVPASGYYEVGSAVYYYPPNYLTLPYCIPGTSLASYVGCCHGTPRLRVYWETDLCYARVWLSAQVVYGAETTEVFPWSYEYSHSFGYYPPEIRTTDGFNSCTRSNNYSYRTRVPTGTILCGQDFGGGSWNFFTNTTLTLEIN
jgi:hypothetical protein